MKIQGDSLGNLHAEQICSRLLDEAFLYEVGLGVARGFFQLAIGRILIATHEVVERSQQPRGAVLLERAHRRVVLNGLAKYRKKTVGLGQQADARAGQRLCEFSSELRNVVGHGRPFVRVVPSYPTGTTTRVHAYVVEQLKKPNGVNTLGTDRVNHGVCIVGWDDNDPASSMPVALMLGAGCVLLAVGVSLGKQR